MGTVDAIFLRPARWRSGLLRSFRALLLVAVLSLGGASSAAAAFGISEFSVTARNADGTIDGIAATHPFALVVHLGMNADSEGEPEGVLGGIRVDLPSGLVGNSQGVPQCSTSAFEGFAPVCSGATQIGVFRGIIARLGEVNAPIYNLVPTPGTVAAFGVSINGGAFVQRLSVVGSGTAALVRLSGSPPAGQRIVDVEEELWGVPADHAHDSERVCQKEGGGIVQGCSAEAEERPLITLPAACVEPLRTTVTATSPGPPAVGAVATALSRDSGGNPLTLIECEAVPFDPRLSVQTEAAALSPTSLSLRLEVPQYEDIGLRPGASVAGVSIELPEGLVLNPSAGAWLTGCPPAAIGLETAPGVQPPSFGEDPPSCPAGSRLGSVILRTPLVNHELSGAIYLATPAANSFAAQYAIYLVIEDAATGTLLKIPGRLEADPTDGRLTAVIPEMPPLPFTELQLEFTGGVRAPLVNPPACGKYSTEAVFTPSTAPLGLPVRRTAVFSVSPRSGSCPVPEAERDPVPSFQAGTDNQRAGSDSPLVISLSRQDAGQHFGSFELTSPPGLVASLGSTPVGAEVGSVRVEAGVGSQPLGLDGKVYLGGPYKGAPYSLEVVVPGQVGPFDLGTIVERVAVDVDPTTARVSVRADPLPQIREGVPLQLRGLRIDLDRPDFIRNPTNCEPMAITGTATTSLGQMAPISSSFQVGECATLAFRPKLSMSLSGSSHRGAHPGVKVTLRPRSGEANLREASVMLPPTELLDTRNVKDVCPAGLFASGRCPKGALVGHAEVSTPLLDRSLEGDIYLRSSKSRLPVLAVTLRGEVESTFVAQVDSVHRRLRFRLRGIPDVPLGRVALDLFGGKRGVIVDSGGVCSAKPRLKALLTAQNGRTATLEPRIALRCGEKSKAKKKQPATP